MKPDLSILDRETNRGFQVLPQIAGEQNLTTLPKSTAKKDFFAGEEARVESGNYG
jgi:hypothetical protein